MVAHIWRHPVHVVSLLDVTVTYRYFFILLLDSLYHYGELSIDHGFLYLNKVYSST
jgi:hypothetical protein